ncbi:exosortase Y [Mucilaginibacter sp. SG564]|uniref:exosortase Y n=1 Tax=Mucilaginibacter sp. SG564 TaxID=2587022 RepID=UPI0020A6D358|nr:glycosyltransferase [Mucilaginibacter sp. SG564]NOW98785.1 exosortase/archaeosortase family protein [Mucilaginibacter sp. SG564]
MVPYSIIILTYNEDLHLPRLLESITPLSAPVFILDSGSTDQTIQIAQQAGAVIQQHPFENHPKQWDHALKSFDIQTPWVICFDADQIVTPELKELLLNFNDAEYRDIDGIYFNRKNFFKGRWIKHGGYYPIYLLKMFRYKVGYSDLNEGMDHRFIVPGKTTVWKSGHILEENLKENNISFWIDKHNRYSDLAAREEVERMQNLRHQTIKPNLLGSPDERTAWLKRLWWQLPRYLRPWLYFGYRMTFQLGVLDGRTGIIFHFLQGFWFRLIIDVKIDEILSSNKKRSAGDQISPIKFALKFIILFLLFYYFNILFLGLTSHGNHYNAFLATYLNYIQALRSLLLSGSAFVLRVMGFDVIHNQLDLLVAGKGSIRLAYDCLGLGVMSFFSAFVIAYPKQLKSKLLFLILGLFGIQFLNIIRFVLLALFWSKKTNGIFDHHTIFNIVIYLLILISLYFWVKREPRVKNQESRTRS